MDTVSTNNKLVHWVAVRFAGVAWCGARESNGAKMTTRPQYVDCPLCRARKAASMARDRKRVRINIDVRVTIDVNIA